MKIYNSMRLCIFFIIALAISLSNMDLGWAIELKLKKTLNLTEEGKRELRPEIHVVKKNGKSRIFIVRRKLMKPYLLREFFFENGKQGKEMSLLPREEGSPSIITDFGSIFVNGEFYLVPQVGEASQSGFLDDMSKSHGPGSFGHGSGRRGRGGSMGQRASGLSTTKLLLQKYDGNFNIAKSVVVMEESLAKKRSLIAGGREVGDLVIEQGDDPGVISDGENIYVITELRKRSSFKKDEPQYRVHTYDTELNELAVTDIPAGRFNGGFQKLIYPIFRQQKFWLLGEFVPEGYGDPDIPPRLRIGQPERKNKDLFVMQYDRNWNTLGNGWQLTETFPGIEYYATGFVPYKDHFFATHSFATDISSKNRGRLGDGEMHLSVFDKDFRRIKDIEISDKVCTQGNLAVFYDHLLMVYVEKQMPESSLQERVRGRVIAKRADIIMKIFDIVD